MNFAGPAGTPRNSFSRKRLVVSSAAHTEGRSWRRPFPNAPLPCKALRKCVDLVVTSDTSVAHLAGALGVETWMATPLSPDWRWLLQREDSPWYPTMRLFRQKKPGGWTDVFVEIEDAARRQLARMHS